MVGKLIFVLFLPLSLFSVEFTASISRNPAYIGEPFVLNLTLKDASAKGYPSLDVLQNMFTIHSQQQSQSMSMLNGRVTSSTTWKISLIATKEELIVIPPISLETSSGVLSTQPIQLDVMKGSPVASVSNNAEAQEVVLTVDVSNKQPYKNEPFFYTFKIIAKTNLADLKAQKISIDDAILEENGEPMVYRTIVDGVAVNCIEISYLITPLKSGSLKIPSTMIQGMMPVKRAIQNRFGYDDDFDPFAMLHGFAKLKPFTLVAEEIVVEVKPPLPEVNPWLPAKDLKIEEVWNEAQSLQVGEPLIRQFRIIAKGINASQLPSLSDAQAEGRAFKIYADKPELKNEASNGEIISTRIEQYTLIAQQAGIQIFPEIELSWWDVENHQKKVAKIPMRVLQISPPVNEEIKQNRELKNEETEHANENVEKEPSSEWFIYAAIGGLVFLLAGALIWGVMLQRKIASMVKEAPLSSKQVKVKSERSSSKQSSDGPKKLGSKDYSRFAEPNKKKSNEKKEKLPDLNPT